MQSGTTSTGPARSVLVCDDTESIRRLMRINLELVGFAVEEAVDGHQAMARLIDPDSRPPTVIVLDAQMAPYDGWWAIAAIRAHPRLDHVPTLLVTAATPTPDEDEVLRCGFDGFISKPFDPGHLVATVSRLAARGRVGRHRP
ncbi:MAG: response regulator [Dermatophilaceae bacterium]